MVFKQLKRSVFTALLVATAGLAAGSSAAGWELPYPVESDSIRQIEAVEVTGRRVDNTVIPAQVLTGTELRKLSAHSVADAIRYFSGVQIKDYGGIGGLKTINIRSMGSRHVGVFYDGIQVGNAQNGIVDLGRFSLENMEAVSLYNGQKSNVFQPAKDFASAGSVYLQTRMPRFENGRRDNFRATLKAGSFTTVHSSMLWEHRFSDEVSGSASAEFLYTDGKYKFRYSKKDGYDTTAVRQNGDLRLFRAEAGVFGRVKNGDWKAKLYYYTSERGYPGASVREEPGVFRNQDRQWDDNFFAQGSFRKKMSPFYSLMLNGKYAYDDLHYLSDPRLDVTTMYIDNRYRQQEVYFSAANEFTLMPGWTANLSGDLQWNKLNADLTDFVYPRRFTALGAAATSFKFSRLSFQGSLLFTHVTDKVKNRALSARDRNKWTPSVIVSYQVLRKEELFVRAFYKRIFRMPTLNDNYYTFIGNVNLDPEFTTQYNAGAAYNKTFGRGWFRHLDMQLDFYFNQVEDKIIAMPTSNQFRWTMINLGFVEIRGADFSAMGGMNFLGVDLTARVSYTYQKAQDFTNPSSEFYGGQIPYVPWHSGSIVLGGQYRGWELNYSFIYTGQRYESVANIAEHHAEPWYTHDLSVSKKAAIGHSTLRLTAEVNNIFNQQYEVVRCYPMPGTNFKFIISCEL